MNFTPILPVITVPNLDDSSVTWFQSRPSKWTLSIVGLGDVGGTLAQALCIMGSDAIKEIKLFDLDPNRLSRYILELNQILGPFTASIPVRATDQHDLFKADMVIFTASKSVPAVGEQVQDMRMIQFESNAQLVRNFVKEGVGQNFQGLYAIVSDPVDLLCQVARDALEHYGQQDHASIRIKGFGLGVMNARAMYYARNIGCETFENSGRVYGPHGKDLIVVNDIGDQFDEALSERLRELTVQANIEVRALGFKPYIAPAVSSAAYSIKACIEGYWHYSTVPWHRQFLGCLNIFDQNPLMESLPSHPTLVTWLKNTLTTMERDYATLHSL